LFTPAGDLRRFVNVFLNERDIRHLQQGSTPLSAGDVLTILPAIAGG
jgi:molybdopterin converting factor small subunit